MKEPKQEPYVPDFDWGYEDPSDQSCGSPCTPDGCHESHATGTFILVGPSYGDEGDRWLNESEVKLASAAPDLAAALEAMLVGPPWSGTHESDARALAVSALRAAGRLP